MSHSSKPIQRAILVLMLTATVVAGSPPASAVAASDPEASSVLRDLSYTSDAGPDQTLDLYLPTPAGIAPYPIVVWIHGGGWHQGDKQRVPVDYLLAEGYAIASINYRLTDNATFPAQIQDVNAALQFLWESAADYHLDRARFIVAGSSAGGHLAALAGLSANDRPVSFDTDPSIKIAAIIDLFGPTDLTVDFNSSSPAPERRAYHPVISLLGGSVTRQADLARAASPIVYVDGDDPPTLIIHGEADPLVPIAQSQALYEALIQIGGSATMITLPETGHGGPEFVAVDVQQQVIAFLAEIE